MIAHFGRNSLIPYLVFYQFEEESPEEEDKSEEDDERIGSGTTRFPSGLLLSGNNAKTKISDTRQMFSQEDLSHDRDSKAHNDVEEFMEEYNDEVNRQTLENAIRLKHTIHTSGAVPQPGDPPCKCQSFTNLNFLGLVYSINSSEYGRDSNISDEDIRVASLKSLHSNKNNLGVAFQSKGKLFHQILNFIQK